VENDDDWMPSGHTNITVQTPPCKFQQQCVISLICFFFDCAEFSNTTRLITFVFYDTIHEYHCATRPCKFQQQRVISLICFFFDCALSPTLSS